MYETIPARTVALENLADRLDDVHDGRDNYYTEPPVMREILQFVRKSSDIPKEVMPKLVRVVLRCRIGRGLSYRDGVSPAGQPLYDQFFNYLDDSGILYCVISLFRTEINPKLSIPICQKHLSSVLSILRPLAISDRLKSILDFLIADIPNAHKANTRKPFLELSAPLIKWK
jgi:hypothetical protein